MDAAYVTALAALGGSVVGSATSLMTTYLTQSGQRRIDRTAREAAKRETLYGQFIDETSKLYADAIRSDNDDPTMMVSAAALLNRMRLFASREVIVAGEQVLATVVRLNTGPNLTLKDISEEMARTEMAPLQAFGEACRRELDGIPG